MKKTKRPVNTHKAYHAHIYFDDATKDTARKGAVKLSSCSEPKGILQDISCPISSAK